MLGPFVPKLMVANEFHVLKENDDYIELSTAISDFLSSMSVDGG
jgi:hypothetical protein